MLVTLSLPLPLLLLLLFYSATDAEAAFKKLTAAFENLHDPARQAMSRAEASGRQHRYTRRGTESSSSRSRGSSGDDGNYKADGHGDRGARSGGNGSGEAPRWCREGEYVPEAARKEEATTTDTGRREVSKRTTSWNGDGVELV